MYDVSAIELGGFLVFFLLLFYQVCCHLAVFMSPNTLDLILIIC